MHAICFTARVHQGWVMINRAFGRKWLVRTGIAGAVVVIATVILILSQGDPTRTYPPARTRTTIDFTACLLTQPAGIDSSSSSAAAWRGILQAQTSTDLRAQFLAVTAPDTASDAAIAVNTLALRKCDLIVSATPVETAAINSRAPEFPNSRFLIITTAVPSATRPNVINVTAETQQIAARLAPIVEQDAKPHS